MPSDSHPRATVCLTVDFDAVSLWMSWGARGARILSRGEFGARIGAPRLLELFQEYKIPTTWFIPGHTADTYSEMCARVSEQGHEIGNHGYLHEAFDLLSPDEARRVIRKANATLQRVTGQTPRGMRVPAGDFDGELFEIVVDEGFSYDSSIFGEFEPFWCRAKDILNDEGPNQPGAYLDLVELPFSFVTNDFHYFEFNYANPSLPGNSDPNHVFSIWAAEFDYMYEHVPGGMLVFTLHPQSIGWGLRTAMLERFINHCQGRTGTRFSTCEEVVAEFRRDTGSASAART
jgi:peptidoglycan/xylan/chitin deacetylase (PgdA/CDA1 family)